MSFQASALHTADKMQKHERNKSLDFTKGVLVVGMLLYHVAVFFISDQTIRELITTVSLDFVSGSWVFISGLIVILHYKNKFQTASMETARRLWVRAVKIILIFIILNLIIAYLGLSDIERVYDKRSIIEIFTHGNGVLTSFEILIGIGYVLLLAPAFLFLRVYGMLFSAGILVVSSILAITGQKFAPNFWIMLCGIGGMVAAYILSMVPLADVNAGSQKRNSLFLSALACTVIYYLLRLYGGFEKNDIYVYLFGVASIIATIYMSYEWLWRFGLLDRLLRLLGRYSLVAYIGQMAIIWGWDLLARDIGVNWPYMVNLLLVSSILVLLILLLDYMRKHSRTVSSLYGIVFG